MSRRTLSPEVVFDTAEQIVDERGIDGLTIAALAEHLGVRGPSLYTHVSGLDAVRAAVQVRTMAGLSDVLRDAAMGRTGGEAMRAMCDAFRAFAKAHPHRYLAMTQSPIDPTLLIEASAGADAATRAALRAFGLDDNETSSAQFGLFATAHGFVSLEIAGVFATALDDADARYRDAIDRVVAAIELAPARSA